MRAHTWGPLTPCAHSNSPLSLVVMQNLPDGHPAMLAAAETGGKQVYYPPISPPPQRWICSFPHPTLLTHRPRLTLRRKRRRDSRLRWVGPTPREREFGIYYLRGLLLSVLDQERNKRSSFAVGFVFCVEGSEEEQEEEEVVERFSFAVDSVTSWSEMHHCDGMFRAFHQRRLRADPTHSSLTIALLVDHSRWPSKFACTRYRDARRILPL